MSEAPPFRPSVSADGAILPLAVRGLGLAFGGRAALTGVDFDLDGRGLTVVLGANGAGKSVLLRVLHGLLPADRGEIRWNGRPPGPPVWRRQAMVFQKPVLLRRSVAANIDFALAARGLPRAVRRRRLAAVLESCGLGELAHRPARRLSGGEQQRVALARALALDPELLLLDEPTASLDPSATRAIEELLRRSGEAGTRVVLVTHDVAQARRLAEEVVFLHEGRVVEQAPAARFFAAPRTAAARAYIEGRLPP